MQKLIYFTLNTFAVLAAFIGLLNLPAFVNATRGAGSLMSYIMLGCTLLLAIRFSLKSQFDSNNTLTLLTITILSYLGISTFNAIIWEENLVTAGGNQTENLVYVARVMLQTTVLMVGSYKYALFSHSQGQLHRYINILIVIMLFGAVITILSPFLGFYSQGFFIETSTSGTLARPAGFYMNPNSAGYHAVATLLLVISLLFRTKTSRILVSILIFITLLSAFITLSKGAILMCLITIFTYFSIGTVSFQRLQSKSKTSLLLVGGFIVGTIVQTVLYLISNFNQLTKFEQSRLNEVMGLLGGKLNTETTTSRSDLAATGFEWISKAPIFGWGFGAFHYFRFGGDAGVHNMFLMLMGESGVIPTLLYIIFYLFGIYKSLKIKNIEYRYMSLTFFLFTLFFANGSHNLFDNYEIGFLFGLICALDKMDNIERNAIEN